MQNMNATVNKRIYMRPIEIEKISIVPAHKLSWALQFSVWVCVFLYFKSNQFLTFNNNNKNRLANSCKHRAMENQRDTHKNNDQHHVSTSTKSFNVRMCTRIRSLLDRITHTHTHHRMDREMHETMKLHIFIRAKHAKQSNNSIDHNIKSINIYIFFFILWCLFPCLLSVHFYDWNHTYCGMEKFFCTSKKNLCKMIDAY